MDETTIIDFAGRDTVADPPESHRATIARHHHEVAVKELVDDGRLLPRFRDHVLDFVCALDDGSSVQFANGQHQGKAEWLLEFLATLPRQVNYGATDMSDPPPAPARQDLPYGFTVNPDRQALADAASALAEQETICYSEAIRRIEPLRVCRRLICLSYAAMSDLSRAA